MAHANNVIKSWKGAVEPARTSPSGNEIKLWKGAVNPTDEEESGDGKLGLLSAGLYSPTGTIITLGKLGKP